MREMKNSGIEWIGDIPVEWDIKKIKKVCTLYTGNSIKDDEKGKYTDSENAIPYIATKEIDTQSSQINYKNGMYIKKDDGNFKIANKDSTLMCIEGGSAGKKIAYLNQDVCFVNKLCCFSAKSVDNKFMYYYLKSPNFNAEFNFHITGLIGGVSQSEIREFFITIPPLLEQKKIADFLHSRVSEIDKIISETKESIESYKEYKQAVITEAVTKGLDKNVPMKDSGIEWIGQIPADWKETKVKNIANKVTDGAHISPETDNGVFDFISTSDVNNGKINFDTCLKTSKNSYKYLVNTGCKPQINDVLISKDGTVGKTVVIDFEHDFVVASSLVIIRPNTSLIYSYYLNYNLQSKFVQDALLMLMHGAGLKRVSVEKNANLFVVLPPISEQIKITKYLDSKCSKIDDLISEKESLISNLEEYKKSLIYEYVTGKKAVE